MQAEHVHGAEAAGDVAALAQQEEALGVSRGGDLPGKGLVLVGQLAPHHEEAQFGAPLQRSLGRAHEAVLVLGRAVAAQRAHHHLFRSDAQFGAQRIARRLGIREGFGVVAVVDDLHARSIVARAGVDFERRVRHAHDAPGQVARRDGASAPHGPFQPGAAGLEVRVPDAPENVPDAQPLSRQAAKQVGVVHPALQHVGPLRPQLPFETNVGARRIAQRAHAQGGHGDAAGLQAGAQHALARQRDDAVPEDRAAPVGFDQAVQKALGSAHVQAHDHVGDVYWSRRHACCSCSHD